MKPLARAIPALGRTPQSKAISQKRLALEAGSGRAYTVMTSGKPNPTSNIAGAVRVELTPCPGFSSFGCQVRRRSPLRTTVGSTEPWLETKTTLRVEVTLVDWTFSGRLCRPSGSYRPVRLATGVPAHGRGVGVA
jgi:hypothetical protein